MDSNEYLQRFQKALDSLDQEPFRQNGLELKVGVWLNSVVLKIQKSHWRNQHTEPFSKGIFFSIWVNNRVIKTGKLFYNIHALKLRELDNYKLKSRYFAVAFRSQFKAFENQWPNVSTKFGPLTLMEGGIDLDDDNLESTITGLAHKFVDIQFIIDNILKNHEI